MPLNTWFAGKWHNLTQPSKKPFRVNRVYPKILRNRKQRIERRLDHKRRWSEQPTPMMSASNIHIEMADRSRATNYGGIGCHTPDGPEAGISPGDRCSAAIA